jgi:hypothetical protein
MYIVEKKIYFLVKTNLLASSYVFSNLVPSQLILLALNSLITFQIFFFLSLILGWLVNLVWNLISPKPN